MKKIIALLALLLTASASYAQPSGQLDPGQVWGNPLATVRTAIPASVAAMLDRGLCSTTGAFPVRTSGGWVCGIFSTNLSLVGNVLTASGGGGGAPGGANTNVQFNNASAFGGSANLTWISPTLQIGSTAGATGILAMAGITSGIVSIKTQDVAGTYNFNLPTTAGSSGQCLGSGGGGGAPMTWATCAAPVGANTQLQFNNAGVFGASANLTWVSPKLTIGLAGTATGQLGMAGVTSGNATIQAQAAAGTPTLTLPNTSGTFAVNATGLIALDTATGQLTSQMATGFLLGRSTAGAGVFEQIIVGTNLTLTGGTLNAASGGAGNPACSVSAAVAGNNLTISLLTATGATPSVGTPCDVTFTNSTITTGTLVTRTVNAATTLVLNSGSTLGAINVQPFRVWVTFVDSGSTAVLGASIHSANNAIYPLEEAGLITTTACNACATASTAGTIYTTVAQTSKPFRIAALLDWGSGLTTAGTWASGPTKDRPFGPGMRKPGDVVQAIQFTTSTQTMNATAVYVNSLCAATITPTSSPNLVSTTWSGPLVIATAGDSAKAALNRGGTVVGVEMTVGGYAAANAFSPIGSSWTDAPGSAGAVTYAVEFKQLVGTGGLTFPHGTGGCIVQLQEIMG